MEYDLTQLDDAIFYYLSTVPNVPQSVHMIYNALCDQNICPALKSPANRDNNKLKLICTCNTLDSRFKNIKVLRKNNTIYVVLSTNKESTFDSFPEDTHEQVPPLTLVEYMLTCPEYSSSLNFTDYVDNKDTVLHLICRHARYDLLQRVLTLYDVDPKVQNVDHITPYDVLPFNSGDKSTKIMADLVKYECEKEVRTIRNMLTELRKHNTELQNVNAILINETNKAKATVSKWKLMAISELVTMVGIGVAYCML